MDDPVEPETILVQSEESTLCSSTDATFSPGELIISFGEYRAPKTLPKRDQMQNQKHQNKNGDSLSEGLLKTNTICTFLASYRFYNVDIKVLRAFISPVYTPQIYIYIPIGYLFHIVKGRNFIGKFTDNYVYSRPSSIIMSAIIMSAPVPSILVIYYTVGL